MTIALAQYVACSVANGPGKRAVLWVQGCEKNCYHCCNPQFQEFLPIEVPLSEICNQIIKDCETHNLRGLTLSGGEPLHPRNAQSFHTLINNIRQKKDIDILAFTGYTESEISEVAPWAYEFIDLLIAGPYIHTLHHSLGLVASTNQKIIRCSDKFSDITDDEIMYGKRIIETHINKAGGLMITGLVHPDDFAM